MLYLASQSPRRLALLRQIGIEPRLVPVAIDEGLQAGESAEDYVLRLALEKARAGWAVHADAPALGSDTSVVLDGHVLGKPRGRAHALEMLTALGGREHRVLTAVAVVDGRQELHRLSESRVRLRPLSLSEADAYWISGEPADKAGAYAIQGLGAVFVEHLSGSFSGVMGLPLFETAEILHRFGVEVPPAGKIVQ
jgi:septum formation protein